MKALLVGGTFDNKDGKASYIVEKLARFLDWNSINGGNIEVLRTLSESMQLNVLLWMPNVDNDEPKILPQIKKYNPSLLLIQSKRVIEKSYTESDVVGRMLQSHANLGLMITKEKDLYNFKLLDPLGNIWANTTFIEVLANKINARVQQILEMKRIGSVSAGEKREFLIEPEFISIIQEYGHKFTKFVNAINPNRLLGNASTRCAHGFPGIRSEGRLFVTRRNVNKETLSTDDFVEIEKVENSVRYYGGHKPSVDTPIQIRLFNYYQNVNYMLHGHVYVKNGLMTKNKIPCGFIDEFNEIVSLMPDPTASNFVINLKGHGCLIMARNLDFFEKQELVGRQFPEG